MRVFDNYLLVENLDEVRYGDEIRQAKIGETPKEIPALYYKEMYYGRLTWIPITRAKFDKKKGEIVEQLKQMQEISKHVESVE